MTVLLSGEAKDRAATFRNRARPGANKNLLFWYRSFTAINSGTFPIADARRRARGFQFACASRAHLSRSALPSTPALFSRGDHGLEKLTAKT